MTPFYSSEALSTMSTSRPMTIERYVRLAAGLFVASSVVLGYIVSPYFFLFTLFVGLNLLQSAFTEWCPLVTVLRALNVPGDPAPASRRADLADEGGCAASPPLVGRGGEIALLSLIN
jgi:hypothetical protein